MTMSKLSKILDLFFCIISLVLVFISPSVYSYDYCKLIHDLFLITFAYNLYKNRKEGIFSFNLLFSISIYLTSFVYPVFIYNTSNRHYGMFSYDFNENIITYSTAVVYMAYCFLQLGLNSKRKRIRKQTSEYHLNINLYKRLNILVILFTFILFYFLLNRGTDYFTNQFIYELNTHDRYMAYVFQATIPLAYSILILAFMLPVKRFTFFSAIFTVYVYTIIILSTGSRTIPLSIIILSLFLYNDKIKKMGIPSVLILGISFVIIMALAGSLRGGGEQITMSKISQESREAIEMRTDNYYLFGHELIICNRNLYFLINSTDKYGFTYGTSISSYFLAVVPFLRSIVISITGYPEYLMDSAQYNTFLSSGINHTKGLGTHAVADIYICWGILGVMIIFFFYGYIISLFKENKSNIYYSIAYYIILSNAIYACRATIFNLNGIVLTIITTYLVLHAFTNSPSKRRFYLQK